MGLQIREAKAVDKGNLIADQYTDRGTRCVWWEQRCQNGIEVIHGWV